MNILILGAGAIGSLYGAKLSKLNNVILIARKGHINNINKFGLKIKGIENKIYRIKAATKINKINHGTSILLTTKVNDSKKAISRIKNLIKKETTILCLQNGLDSEKIVKNIVGRKCIVLRGITSFGAVFLKAGTVECKNYGYTAIEKSHLSKKLAKNFSLCGLNAYVSKNIKIDIWKKLILNCVLNPLTTILRIENKDIADKKLNSLKKWIIEECLAVAKRDGIKFNIDFLKFVNEAVKDSRNISSMQQDLIKGKYTEIDYLNGAVVNLGRKYGIKCPVNKALVEIIKDLESQ